MSDEMGRRGFLGSVAVGATAVLLPTAAGAETPPASAPPEVSWRLTSSFPKALDLLYGGAVDFAKRVELITGGRFRIEVLAPGEVVPGLQALDAVQAGTVEACQTSLDYFYGKDPTFALATAIPFGMNAREQTAFAFEGGGGDLLDEFLADFDVLAMPAGNTGAQMGGFFRREIKSVGDLSGLKIRVGGLAGRVLQKLGSVPDQTARSELYAALQGGSLDAVTWVSPYDDLKIEESGKPGLQKVAPYYYYPGWWRGGSMVHLVFNRAKFGALPQAFRDALRTAATATHTMLLASYDARNPAALKKLVISGAQLRGFPQDVLEAAYRAANEVYKEIADGNPKFKKLLDATLAFRADQYLWWQVSEYTFDNFMIRQRARG
jgi:TRAP-type mannitol/chloroaromatic compound transport system substrate-binding protein